MPLLNTVVFSVVFMRVTTVETPLPYPLFAFSGLWVWNFFASSLRFSVTSLTSNSNLVSKVYFPREILPFSTVAVCFVDFAVGALVLAGLMAWYGVAPGIHLLWLPLVVLVQVTFTVAVALTLAMGNLFYRDVRYLFEILIAAWMFATSVVYPVDRVDGVLGTILRLNPMTGIVDAYRASLLLNTPPPATLGVAAIIAVTALAAAWALFHHLEFEFAEHV
jgi:ABC-type polysaccharide/polyol phosphate export permease